MRDFISDHLDGIMSIFIVLILIGTFVGIYYDQKSWERYTVQHHCEARGYTSPSNGFGFDSKGQPVVTYNPGQTIYVCDEGQTIIIK